MSANENRPVAIRVSGVKKMYRLGQIGGGTLQADLQSWWARVRGKEDPNTKIGEGERVKGQTFMALNGIDLTIYQGEAVGIIGSNGAGKSTLLKLLSKVTAPTEGEIDIYGRIASMLEVGTGFNGELTGRENVYMNGAILGMTKQEIDAKMEQIIEFSEVRDFIDTPVKRYSSGMFVKLAFSVAAHLDSEIMIMDEVLAVGDMAFQKKCLTKMREAAQQDGRTVLYVSHNMNTIRQLCDRCIVLDKGKIVYQGNIEDSIKRYIGNKVDQFKTEYYRDELNYYNKDSELGKYALFEKLTILKCEESLESNKDSIIEIEIICNLNCTFDRLKLGIQLYDDYGDTLGFGSLDLLGIKTGLSTIRLSFDHSFLTKGSYSFRLNLFTIDDNYIYMGSLAQSNHIFFNIFESENELVWHKEWWKNIRFDSMLSYEVVKNEIANLGRTIKRWTI
ncbi:ABC transporter ATP-binding protein [Ruminococcus sp. JL13D9]|uniref:ABC transporter ATP-binding protein n=1 Tax=Ruminococcus sp. JL13D9 TaxID=3233381 RepID=UPI00389B0DB1